ncbi:heavy-metal-associated domain-containing protein [Pseudarthrobacter sp. TAF60_1]|jgi:copper chaperone|uniref:heavy-metal-associated domain-containing protein n=1 Tax=Pseudarthrobacter sp. TAF60_1 TaxID=3233071 RepID=UPI003F973205
MSLSGNRTQLPLASAASGCSCCSPAAAAPTAAPAPAAGAAVVMDESEFSLDGLTCGHCVKSVEEAVSSVAGVENASVSLVPGGRSLLVVSGSADHAAIRDAVTSAGYSVSSR